MVGILSRFLLGFGLFSGAKMLVSGSVHLPNHIFLVFMLDFQGANAWKHPIPSIIMSYTLRSFSEIFH